MQEAARLILSLVLCSTLGGALAAQPPMLPGQLQRQSLSGGTIFRCLFDRTSDAENGDGRPDYWTRKSGFDNGIPFPAYTEIKITQNPNPFSDYALRMNIDGGAAALFSPKIPIRPGMSYTVSAYVETDSLVFSNVSILAHFYGNDATKPIHTLESRKIRNTNGWHQLTIGPVPANQPNVQFLAVGLLVMPDTRKDYGSRVHFTNVEIRESPTVSLEMENDHHLFFTTRNLSVQCQFRGIDPAQHSVLFILENPFGRVLRQRETELMVGNNPVSRFVVTPQNAQEVIPGIATWENLPIASPGFYRIRLATPPAYIQTLRLPSDQAFEDPLDNIEPLTFVVMSPDSFRPGGEFGWSLDGWTLDEITQTLPTLSQSGLSHLKLPVWISPDASQQHRAALLRLCDSLSAQQVLLTGLLDPVPQSISSKISHVPINAASILGNNPQLWGNSLQPTLRTLSLLVKDWQWTSDRDESLIDLFFELDGTMSSAGENRLRAFQKLFDQDQFGFGIGITWNWNRGVPMEELPIPNFFLNFPIDASIIPEDAASALAEMTAVPFRRSVSVTPLPAEDYPLDTRIADLVKSLVYMKAAGIDRIFLPSPKEEQTGVLRSNSTPNELYLPWRTTATLLSRSRLLGSITLPNRSRNYCFDGGGKCIMVVWNDGATTTEPVLESLYLGNEPEIIDVWGRHIVPEPLGNQQTIPVTSTPTFVTGLNIDVTKFRLSMQTGVHTISAVPNRTYEIPFVYRNNSLVPVSIRIAPEGPRSGDWTITPPSQSVNLEPGVAGAGMFNLRLEQSADTGRRLFQYNVRIAGIDAPEFAVYDEMMIGDPDVFMEFVSRLKENGDIEVIQDFLNNTEKTYTYTCRLTVPNRQMPPVQVRRQGFGRAEHVYTIPRGKALLDAGVTEVLLRAIPMNDPMGALGEPMVYTIPLVSE